MRVHYRVDAGTPAAADSAARDCASERWWCDALAGYAAHARGDARRADSSFASALAAMPDSVRCAWTDIRVLLPGDTRDRYERMSCAERTVLEHRYWLLGQPRLAAEANEWHSEFLARHVQSWLAERSRTPHNLSWGADAEELLLRYGWPVAWGRVQPVSSALGVEPGIIGHDPSPSFAFGPREELLDTLATGGDDGWDLRARFAESRYAPAGVRRVTELSSQLSRFRRGDSVLVAAAFEVDDDSLVNPVARLAVALSEGRVLVGPPDTSRRGIATFLIAGELVLAGVEIADSASGTLARSRTVYPAPTSVARAALSDLLLYHAGGEPVSSLDSALARALSGSVVRNDRPLGLYWETYGLADAGERVDDRDARLRLAAAQAGVPVAHVEAEARQAPGGSEPRDAGADHHDPAVPPLHANRRPA